MATAVAALPVSRERFDLIRGRENNFPLPVKKRTVTVGTFDAATGKFSDAVPKYEEEVDLEVLGRADGGVDAIEVALQFKIKNRVAEAVVAIKGLAPVRTSTTDSITVSGGRKKFVRELPRRNRRRQRRRAA